jgi:hypothetical protein
VRVPLEAALATALGDGAETAVATIAGAGVAEVAAGAGPIANEGALAALDGESDGLLFSPRCFFWGCLRLGCLPPGGRGDFDSSLGFASAAGRSAALTATAALFFAEPFCLAERLPCAGGAVFLAALADDFAPVGDPVLVGDDPPFDDPPFDDPPFDTAPPFDRRPFARFGDRLSSARGLASTGELSCEVASS